MVSLLALAVSTAWHGGELMERVITRAAAAGCRAAASAPSTHSLSHPDPRGPGASACGSWGWPGESCTVPPPWVHGPPGPVTRMWQHALLLARAAEVLRAQRLEREEGLEPEVLHALEATNAERMTSRARQELARLEQAWAGGVLGSAAAQSAVLQRVRTVVRQLDELGLLQGTAVHRTAAVRCWLVGEACASVEGRVERLRRAKGQAEAETGGAGGGSGTAARVHSVHVTLRACHLRIRAVTESQELADTVGHVERGPTTQARRRKLERWRRQGYSPKSAGGLCELILELAPTLQDTHPDTWGAAMRPLQEASRAAGESGGGQEASGTKLQLLWVSQVQQQQSVGIWPCGSQAEVP